MWTSGGHVADLGMLLARTDVDSPKHRGITYFVVDMHQPGIDVRPLREMTGKALFNEVFLDDVVVHERDVIGETGLGWPVAKTTLAFERAGLGAGSAGAAESAAFPGTVAGHLDRRGRRLRAPVYGSSCAVVVRRRRDARRSRTRDAGDRPTCSCASALPGSTPSSRSAVHDAAPQRPTGERRGAAGDGKHRQAPHEPDLPRGTREIGLELLGARGCSTTTTSHQRPTTMPREMATTAVALWSPGPSIYGGTDEVQRNIIGERFLGLPRDVLDDPSTPFAHLRKNA